MFSSTLVALALSASAFATVFTTSPVATTSWIGGTVATINWQDDGAAPDLPTFGPAIISLYVGNAIQQTPLQRIGDSVDVSKNGSITFTPDPTVGDNGDFYFIRFESIGTKDAKNPQFPALAFSAKFTLTGMSGKFNASVQAQIDGQSTAPIGGPTSGAPAATSAGSSASTTGSSSAKPTSSASSTASKSGSAASSKPTTNGAAGIGASGAKVILAVAAVFLIALC